MYYVQGKNEKISKKKKIAVIGLFETVERYYIRTNKVNKIGEIKHINIVYDITGIKEY